MSKKNTDKGNQEGLESITKRLDALIRISLESHLDKKNKFNLTTAVKALNSCGLGPSEIANILGKKITDVAPLLYKKSRSDQSVKKAETPEKQQSSSEAGQNV